MLGFIRAMSSDRHMFWQDNQHRVLAGRHLGNTPATGLDLRARLRPEWSDRMRWRQTGIGLPAARNMHLAALHECTQQRMRATCTTRTICGGSWSNSLVKMLQQDSWRNQMG